MNFYKLVNSFLLIILTSSCLFQSDNSTLETGYLTGTESSSGPDYTPVVSSIVIPNNGTYGENGELIFQVNYDKNIFITGTPRIALDIGGSTRYANYFQGTGTTGIEFKYTVVAAENDNDGISLSSTNIDLNGGQMLSSLTLTASGSLVSAGSLTSVLVNTAQAAPNQVAGLNTAPTTSDTELGLTWSIPANNGTAIVNYNVQYRQQGSPTWLNFTPNPTSNSTVVTGLSSGVTYEFRVAANNGVLGAYSGTSTAQVFNLNSLSLALWMDATDINTIYTDTGCTTNVTVDAELVRCWIDKSGFGRDFIQGTGANRPRYRTSGINSLATLDFDGTGDHLVDDDGENYVNGFQSFEFFVVVKSDAVGNDKGILDTKDANGSDDGIALRYDVAGASGGCTNCLKGGIEMSGGGAAQSESLSGVQSTSTQLLGASWNNGTAFQIYVNGVLSSSNNSGAVSGTIGLAQKFIIGKGPKDAGAKGWDGDIGEVVFLNTQLTPANRTIITNYLKSKWGIP